VRAAVVRRLAGAGAVLAVAATAGLVVGRPGAASAVAAVAPLAGAQPTASPTASSTAAPVAGGADADGPDEVADALRQGWTAAAPSPAITPGTATVSAAALLSAAVHARTELPYTGTQVVAGTDGVSRAGAVFGVAHQVGVGSTFTTQAGRTPQVVLEPDSGPVDSALGIDLSSESLAELRRHYALAVAGTSTVAGRSSTAVVASRTDGSPAGRFWLDDVTGLPLRREVLAVDGTVTQLSAFLRVQPGGTAPRLAATAAPAPGGTALGPAAVGALRSGGWSVPAQLPGNLDLFDARWVPGAAAALHLTYTDGLSTVSVFEQRGRLSGVGAGTGWTAQPRAGRTVWAPQGLPSRWAWQGPSTVVTVVSDLPAAAADGITLAFPAGTAERATGVGARLSRGYHKLAAWLP
jgi:sigma-E factor negative regulatory protein RseB